VERDGWLRHGPAGGRPVGRLLPGGRPRGQVLLEAPVPAPAPAQDADAFALDPADPWPYRGLAEPTSPNIAVEDERLFVATDPSRDDGSWSQRPLYYGDSDAGMSFLLVLHTKDGQDPVVTTTWQRGDREAEQTEQLLEPGQRVVQVLVPTDLGDGSVLLVALAAPQAGIALEQPAGACSGTGSVTPVSACGSSTRAARRDDPDLRRPGGDLRRAGRRRAGRLLSPLRTAVRRPLT
jgi:hypothetical protein